MVRLTGVLRTIAPRDATFVSVRAAIEPTRNARFTRRRPIRGGRAEAAQPPRIYHDNARSLVSQASSLRELRLLCRQDACGTSSRQHCAVVPMQDGPCPRQSWRAVAAFRVYPHTMPVLSRPHLPVPAIPLPLRTERMPVCVVRVPYANHGFVAPGSNAEIDPPSTITTSR